MGDPVDQGRFDRATGHVFSEAEPSLTFSIPENVEAEAAIIGAMLSENRLVERAADILSPEDFYEPLHSRIFETTVSLVSQGIAVSPLTLKPYFEDDAALKELGGIGYLVRLSSDTQGFLAPDGIIAQIRELAVRRRMQAGLHAALLGCSDLESTVGEIVAHADAALDQRGADQINQPSGGEALADLLRSYDSPVDGVQCCSIPEIDRLLGKLRPKQMVILAARPGMGKTAVAISYAIGAARNGHGVLFISLEMSSRELAARMAADMCFTHGENSVPFAAINEGRLSDPLLRRVCEAETRMHELPFHIVDTGSLTTGRLNMLVKRYKRRFEAKGQKLELVVVDYLQLVRPDKRINKYEDISEVSQCLKAIAKDHSVGVMALAQLSRSVETRPDKRPQLADLRDSGQIEQDADAVLFLLRDEYYLEQSKPSEMSPKFAEWEANMEQVRGRIEFILAKRRNGRTGIGVGEFHGVFQAVR